MPLIDCLPVVMGHVLESCLLGPGKPFLNILMQMPLVAFQSQPIIGRAFKNGLDNLFLAAHGLNRHRTACHVQLLQQGRYRPNLVRLLIDFALAQALTRCKACLPWLVSWLPRPVFPLMETTCLRVTVNTPSTQRIKRS